MFHVPLQERTSKETGDPTKPVHSLSPLNGQPLGMKEPMGRTIPPISHVSSAQGLDPMASTSLRSP